MVEGETLIPRDIWLRTELDGAGQHLDLGAAAGVSLVLVARKGRRALHTWTRFVCREERK